MRILKFGGSSVASAEAVGAVVDIVRDAARVSPVAVVVSALGGVTDALEKAALLAATGATSHQKSPEQLESRHLKMSEQLAAPEEREEIRRQIGERTRELQDLLRGVSLVRECTPRTRDQIHSYGERLSAIVVAAALRRAGVDAEACDARSLIATDRSFGGARVQKERTERQVQAHFASHPRLQVITGYIGATPDGETTTLGRGGSDLTAALIGAALACERIEIWTDVDGVMSADPRLVPEAFSLERLTYEELMELSHFGAKVVYPPTVSPARARSIPLLIRNTFNRAFPGTLVLENAGPRRQPICGISSIHEIALLRLQGDGMVGVPGTASRLFGALARDGINVCLITQASSEHSICIAVRPEDVARARERVDEEFTLERRAGLIDDLIVEEDLSIIAAVGEEMRHRPGMAGKVFSVLGHRGVNIRAIAQGSSELNISLAVARDDEARALRAIHEAFFADGGGRVHVLLAGPGRVGATLLRQIESLAGTSSGGNGMDLRVAGICSSRRMLLDEKGTAASMRARWERGEGTVNADLAAWVAFAESLPGARILVDCTASAAIPTIVPSLLARGVGVVTANKRQLTLPRVRHEEMLQAARSTGAPVRYGATVGAGLPIVSTLQTLVRVGDRVERIEGILSGTLSSVLTRLRGGMSFSEALREAHALGLTEPDPREDLSGADVARKLLIMARECGALLDLEDVVVEPLLAPRHLEQRPLEAFWKELPELDAGFRDRMESTARGQDVLVYLARFENGKARVGLEAVAPGHPCAALSGADNLVAITTSRYREQPLVIRGPGAGPEVTAAGVLADVLSAATALAGWRAG
jgi:aspartokinase/homoserine dehydrogenase 1